MRKPAKKLVKKNFHVQITLSPFEHSVLVQALKSYNTNYSGHSLKTIDVSRRMLMALGNVYREGYDPHGDVERDQSYTMNNLVYTHRMGYSRPRRRRRR